MRPARLLRAMLLSQGSQFEGTLRGVHPDRLPPVYWVNVCFPCRTAFEFRMHHEHTERRCRLRHVRTERRVLLCDKCNYGLVFADNTSYYANRCAFNRDGRLWTEPAPSFVIPRAAFDKSPLDPADVVPTAQE